MQKTNRFKQIRAKLGLTQDKFGEKLGLKQSQIRDIESGKQKVSIEIAELMEKIFDIDAGWLIFGKGSMQASQVEAHNTKSGMVPIPYHTDVSAAAGNGVLNHYSDTEFIMLSKSFAASFLGISSFMGLEALNVLGESMAPQINDGDIIIIQKDSIIIEGCIYVVQWHGDIMVKRLQRNPKTKAVKLISDNPLCDSYLVEDDDLDNLSIVGKVVSYISKAK